MYPNSICFGLKVLSLYIGTLGPKYILFGYMEPYTLKPYGTLNGALEGTLERNPIWVHGPLGHDVLTLGSQLLV